VRNRWGKYARPSVPKIHMQHPRIFPDGPVPHSHGPKSHPPEALWRRASEKGIKTGEQKFRSLRAPGILAQAPIRTPCSTTVDFGAVRAEISPIGTTTWRALPSSLNPSGHSAWRATHHIDEEVDAKFTAWLLVDSHSLHPHTRTPLPPGTPKTNRESEGVLNKETVSSSATSWCSFSVFRLTHGDDSLACSQALTAHCVEIRNMQLRVGIFGYAASSDETFCFVYSRWNCRVAACCGAGRGRRKRGWARVEG
jgi:hypothetical protein